MNYQQTNISCRVRKLRQQQKLTQEKLARQLGISRQSIISVEKGQCLPSLNLALQLASFFETTIEEIFFPESNQNKNEGEMIMDRNLQPWSPFRNVSTLHDEIDRLFEDAVFAPREKVAAMPTVNIREKNGAFLLEADLPGLKEEDLEVEIGNDFITLRGERKSEEEIKEKNYYRQESSYGSFSRTIALPNEIKPEKASAEMKNGILTLTLPKAETPKTKTIKLKVAKK